MEWFPRLLIQILVALWLSLSVWQFVGSNDEAFARLGSLGVAVVVIMFANINYRLRALDSEFVSNTEGRSKNKADVYALLKECSAIFKGNEEERVTQLKKRIEDLQEKGAEDAAEPDEIAGRIQNVKKRSIWLETSLLVLATIQWGYGDWIHTWVRSFLI